MIIAPIPIVVVRVTIVGLIALITPITLWSGGYSTEGEFAAAEGDCYMLAAEEYGSILVVAEESGSMIAAGEDDSMLVVAEEGGSMIAAGEDGSMLAAEELL